MAQKDAVYKIVTPGMDAKAAGLLKIAEMPGNQEKAPSLESDLISKGWRYLQNDVKQFLKEVADSAGKGSGTDIPEDTINALVDLCLEYTEIDQPYDREILRGSLTRALVWDPEEDAFFYKAPKVKGSSGLIKEAIDKAFFDRETRLTDTADNSSYRDYQRHLFITEPPEESRRVILQFAYLRKMKLEEARTYLTKWSFSDDIRWDDPWELAAACEIACHPAREEDRASDFLEAVAKCVKRNRTEPEGPDNKEFREFIRKLEQQEYDAWVDSYQKHCLRGLEEDFLNHWSWLLLCVHRDRKAKRVVPVLPKEMLREAFPASRSRLQAFIRCHVEHDQPDWSPEALTLRQQILQVCKDRLLRLAAAAYAYARVDDLMSLSGGDGYIPPDRELGFRAIPTPIQKVENNFRQTKVTQTDPAGRKTEKTVSIPNRLCRSDVIKLGIALSLTLEGINHLLEISGFYRLYARDFFEYTLKESLYEVETLHYMDGFRFGVRSAAQLRTDDDMDESRKDLKDTYLRRLEQNYATLAPANRKLYSRKEPNWVREGIRKEERQDSPLSSR